MILASGVHTSGKGRPFVLEVTRLRNAHPRDRNGDIEHLEGTVRDSGRPGAGQTRVCHYDGMRAGRGTTYS